MRRLEAFGHFVWEFVVGDDWRVAVGVVIAIAATAVAAAAGLSAWWIMPLATAGLLALTIWRAARPQRQ